MNGEAFNNNNFPHMNIVIGELLDTIILNSQDNLVEIKSHFDNMIFIITGISLSLLTFLLLLNVYIRKVV